MHNSTGFDPELVFPGQSVNSSEVNIRFAEKLLHIVRFIAEKGERSSW